MNWMKYKFVYFVFSLIIIGSGVFSMIRWGFNWGVDFKGGTVTEYKFDKDISTDVTSSALKTSKYNLSSIQKTQNGTYLLKFAPLSSDQKNNLDKVLGTSLNVKPTQLSYESVGPTAGVDLIKKTIYGMIIATSLILLWIALQFKSFKFGVTATMATLHDSLVLLGSFSLLGHFYGAEVDFLFVTAALTVLSFSVHDTIIVYDRIRETKAHFNGTFEELANKAINETIVRSLNNSFTIIFMLTALILLGGSTIKWFSIALLIGTISGAYSSPFVAVPLLVIWDRISLKFRK